MTGNKAITIQKKSIIKNEINEDVEEWLSVCTLDGFLDMMSGDSRMTYNTKIEESSHVFICDFQSLPDDIKPENTRVIDGKGKIYEVMLYDNVMELDEQWEIYLKYIGGQNNVS